MTGVVGMLAGGAIDNICQSQQCKAGETHTTEVVAGGTALNRIITRRAASSKKFTTRKIGRHPRTRTRPRPSSSRTTTALSNERSGYVVASSCYGVDEGEFEPIKIPEEDTTRCVHQVPGVPVVFQRWKWHTDFIKNMNKQRTRG